MSDSNPRPQRNSSAFSSPEEFLASVLSLQPKLAVFDCDGTLWSGDAGQDFFYWEIAQNLIPGKVADWAASRYAAYLGGKVDEKQMCGEMVTIHAGLPVAKIKQAAEKFFSEVVEPRIFPEMRDLVQRLKALGCEVWAVSSTNDWVISTGVRRFSISPERVLAASVEIENGIATDRLIQVPTDDDKALAIRRHIRRQPDVVFGNSMHDAAMLAISRHAFAINPNPDLEELANKKRWKVYWPQKAFVAASDLAKL